MPRLRHADARRAPGDRLAPRRRRSWALLALGCSALLVGAAATLARAATPPAPSGVFAISPAKRFIVARPPVGLAPTRVWNTTATSYRVRAFPVLLEQQRSGALSFQPYPQLLHTAGEILAVAPRRFTLAPGAERNVSLQWRRMPLRTRAAVVGVVFQGVPEGPRSSVKAISRLLGVTFLRLPGRHLSRGGLTSLEAQQGLGRSLRFLLGVRNSGNVVTRPELLRLTIRDAAGRPVLRKRVPRGLVLPTATRDFTVGVRRALPAGSYRVSGELRFGRTQRRRIEIPMRLTGPGRLPTADLRAGALTASGEIGGQAHARLRLASVGSAPAHAAVRLELFRLRRGESGQRPFAREQVEVMELEPGERTDLDEAFADGLERGTYRLAARYEEPDGTPQTLVADFQAQPQVGVATRLRRFVERHDAALVGALALIALAALLTTLLRRQRRLQQELRRARRPAHLPD